jgi:restriction system protein
MSQLNMQRDYFRLILGRKSKFAEECHSGEFVGADFGFDFDLTYSLHEDWREFNKKYRPKYLEKFPEKSVVAAGLACGALHTICKGIKCGDIVLCPNGSGQYWVGEIISDYYYEAGQNLPHRRHVSWLPLKIDRTEMTTELQNSAGSIGTVSKLSKYGKEIEALMAGDTASSLISIDATVENATEFALEKHLEDFLIKNWVNTPLGNSYDVIEDDGELIGQQYPSDTGPIDILAISKDKKEYLVIELKKGRASDVVVGQIQRYMGFVKEDLLEAGQTVRGIIIALEDDIRIRRALSVANNIDFFRYQINFELIKS